MSEQGTVLGCNPETGTPLRVDYEDGVITGVGPAPAGACPDDVYIAPGLTDLQVNGYLGCDLNAADVDRQTVVDLVVALRKVGTLCFLPTLVTASRQSLLSALKVIAEARQANPDVAHAIPGVHLEGPWISPNDGARGAHPREHVRGPSLDEFDAWQQASGNLVRLVTLSPHWDNAVEIIAELSARGVVVSLGHTDASDELIAAAVAAGASMSTHLGNGIAMHLPRHHNPIWAQLGNDRITAGIIADGFHLPASVFRSMLRAKELERVFLVSDSVSAGGLPPGRYVGVGGEIELNSNGRLGMVGTDYLAGSAMNLAQCVAIGAEMAGLSLSQALALATVNPGRFIGRSGRLEVGASADLIVFGWSKGDTTLAVHRTIANGKAE